MSISKGRKFISDLFSSKFSVLRTIYKYNFYKFSLKKDVKNNTLVERNEIKKMLEIKENVIKKQVKGSGPGGQHVNKTASTILLKDKETNISVKVGNSRDSIVNSGIAKKRLVDKLDLHYNGSESKIAKKNEKIKKQKERQKRKSLSKHQNNEKKD
jgi:protein subunit release factor A